MDLCRNLARRLLNLYPCQQCRVRFLQVAVIVHLWQMIVLSAESGNDLNTLTLQCYLTLGR